MHFSLSGRPILVADSRQHLDPKLFRRRVLTLITGSRTPPLVHPGVSVFWVKVRSPPFAVLPPAGGGKALTARLFLS